MTTTEMLVRAGVLAVLASLLLTLAVCVLRLVSLPLAAAALALDALAVLAARPLPIPAGGETP